MELLHLEINVLLGIKMSLECKSMNDAPLFCLLRNALWGNCETVITDVTKSQRILKEAEKQAVTALVLDAMDKRGVKLPEEVVVDYLLYSLQVEQDNKQLNAAVWALDSLFTKNGINYAIVKGQAVGSLYPNPLLRQSGDIDFYCDRENFEKAKDVLQLSWGVKFDAANSDHHLHFDYKLAPAGFFATNINNGVLAERRLRPHLRRQIFYRLDLLALVKRKQSVKEAYDEIFMLAKNLLEGHIGLWI